MSDSKLRRAARRAAVMAAGGPKAWLPPTKSIPSAKRYSRKPKHTRRSDDT